MPDPIESAKAAGTAWDIPALVAELREPKNPMAERYAVETRALKDRAAAALEALSAKLVEANKQADLWSLAEQRAEVAEAAIREALDAVLAPEHTPASFQMARILSSALAPADTTGDQ